MPRVGRTRDDAVIDDTRGRIFPAGNDPVQGRTRRSGTTFAEALVELRGEQGQSALDRLAAAATEWDGEDPPPL